MKKIILLPVVLLTIFLVLATFVDFSVNDKFPEGKNYINSFNAYKEERFVYIKDKFLVKENTIYTFSISRMYVDGAPFEVIFDLYEDERLIQIVSRDDRSMAIDSATNVFYFSFTTAPKTNYIGLRFVDNGDYQNGTELIDVQLEEGNLFTPYEAYVVKSFFQEPVFYIISVSILIFGAVSGYIWHMLRKNSKRR